MNVQINQLVKSLLQKDTLDQCSVQELEEFAERHPYFGAAQLLLTKKLQTENSEKYDEQLQKTFLFFHNPLWVEHLLNETGNATFTAPAAPPAPAPEKMPDIPITAPAENDAVATETIIPEDEKSTVENPGLSQEDITQEEIESVQEPVDEPLLKIPELKIEPVDPEKNEMLFQPYHTVDYFASQGINFNEEVKPTDKFGQQLKSFTDWLKTMKKLPVAEIGTSAVSSVEQKVEEMAERSVKGKDVFTEAMAEVWEKQGNTPKAIEIYHKLSLLDPSKSAYFAAKIEELKKLI